jgi:hypothetical protein
MGYVIYAAATSSTGTAGADTPEALENGWNHGVNEAERSLG